MKPFKDPSVSETPATDSAETLARVIPVREFVFRDHILPLWAKILSGVFSLATGLTWLSISVLALFFIDLAVLNQDKNLILVFVAVGLSALGAGFILDIAHAQALAGMAPQRQRFALKSAAVMAGVMGLFLAVVHPILAIGFFFGAAVHVFMPALMRLYPGIFATELPSYQNAVSMFAGRDPWGVKQGRAEGRLLPPFVATLGHLAQGLATLITLAFASWLAVHSVLTLGAVFSVTLMTFWGVQTVAIWSQDTLRGPHSARLDVVDYTPDDLPTRTDIFDDEVEVEEEKGLVVENLSAKNAISRKVILGLSSFRVEPGQIIGLSGDGGGGKSLLLHSIMGQTNDKDMLLKGTVLFDGTPIWDRSFAGRGLPAVLVPETPLILPGSAVDNILCFDRDKTQAGAVAVLQKIDVFGVQAARIASRLDATHLSATEAQLLSLARAFHLNPGLYLLDMPETNLTPNLINALISQISVEKNAGRSFVIASRNRNILEICDQILMMEDGHIADRGATSDVLARQSSGWNRLQVPRELESEDRLHTWARAQFNRKGDERNRRNACLLVSEMLALSCQDASPESQDLIFDFKHFKGYCQIAMQDGQPLLSTAVIKTAEKLAARGTTLSPKHPLANIIKLSGSLSQDIKGLDRDYNRKIRVRLDVFDPRLTPKSKARTDDGK